MILTVTAGKGGVGKSTIAYNLGAFLDGVVIDADLGMADLPTGPGVDLHDVLAGRANPLEAVREEGPVNLLPCGRSLGGARAADPTKLVETVAAVDDEYGTVIIDSPAGMRSDVGLPLLVGDVCILVTAPNRAAIADAIRVRELARFVETPLAGVALNRVGGSGEPVDGDRRNHIANALGAPVTPVPDSDDIARAQRNGQPVKKVAPDSAACEQLEKLARFTRNVARC